MSDSSVFTTANTATLSVIRTFMSVPSRDLIDSIGPSTASMVPRIRTVGVGGCCAQATVPNTVAKANEAASRRDVVRMAVSLCFSASHNANTGKEYLFHGRLRHSGFDA